MNAAGHIADMNNRIAQNRALLGSKLSYKEIYEMYAKTPYKAELYQNEKQFTQEEIEQAKQKARLKVRRERVRSFLITGVITIITVLLILHFWSI